MAEVRTDDFLLDVERGNIKGASIIHKFGSNNAVGTTIVPITFTGVYRTPMTPATLEVLSDNALDTAAGSGGRTVEIQGIGPDWGLQEETVSLDGVTPVTLTKTFLRVFRMRVTTSGTYATASTGSHEGTITLRGVGAGQIWTKITDDLGMPIGSTEIGAYTIPKGYEGLVLHREIDIEAAKLCHILFFKREQADDITVPYSPMQVLGLRRELSGLNLDGSPTGASELLVGPCDVGFMAGTTQGTARVECAFKILLLKQNI